MKGIPYALTGVIAMPTWLTSGPLPIILTIVLGIVLLGILINIRMKTIQRNLRAIGRAYYEKDKEVEEEYKAGLIDYGE